MFTKSQLFTLISAPILLVSIPAHAVMSVPYGWYFDGNVGYTKISDIELYGGSKDTKGIGGNINVGYKFMPYAALEIGYTKYANSNVIDQYNVKAGKLESYSYDLTTKGIMPVYDSGIELFAKAGVQRGHTKFVIDDLPALNNVNLDSRNSDHTGFLAAIGGSYYFIPEAGVVVQWARAVGNKNVGTLDLYTIGVTFTFG